MSQSMLNICNLKQINDFDVAIKSFCEIEMLPAYEKKNMNK